MHLKNKNYTSNLNSQTFTQENENNFEVDDIMVEYHPASSRQPVVTHFQDFTRAKVALDCPPEEEPFKPFRCRADFEFARKAMEAALNVKHTEALIKLVQSISAGAQFTLSSHGDLSDVWKKASGLLTPVS